MTKWILQFGFLIFLATAGWLLFNKNDRSGFSRSALTKNSGAHLFKLHKFEARRFTDGRLSGYIEARDGIYDDLSSLTLEGEVYGFQKKIADKETDSRSFTCQELRAVFDRSEQSEFSNQKLEEVDLFRDVQLKFKNYVMKTNFARYKADEERILSPEPIEVISETEKLNGSEGFILELDSNQFEIFGSIVGVMTPKKAK